MNDNTVEIVSLIYSDADNRGFSTACSEVRHDRNRGYDHGRLGFYLNGYYLEDSASRDEFLFFLKKEKIFEKKTCIFRQCLLSYFSVRKGRIM